MTRTRRQEVQTIEHHQPQGGRDTAAFNTFAPARRLGCATPQPAIVQSPTSFPASRFPVTGPGVIDPKGLTRSCANVQVPGLTVRNPAPSSRIAGRTNERSVEMPYTCCTSRRNGRGTRQWARDVQYRDQDRPDETTTATRLPDDGPRFSVEAAFRRRAGWAFIRAMTSCGRRSGRCARPRKESRRAGFRRCRARRTARRGRMPPAPLRRPSRRTTRTPPGSSRCH